MKVCVNCKTNERKYNNGKCKECNNAYQKEYRKTNSYQKEYDKSWKIRYDKMRADPIRNERYKAQRREYVKRKKENDVEFKLRHNTLIHINIALKKKYFNSKVECILGCNYSEYKSHLESQFSSEMNWENYGDYWEIDHIFPLSKGGSFHYKNTQPLTIIENRKKKDKL